MKKLVVLGMLLGAVGTGAFAVGFIGTPTAGLDKGQWSIGGEYSYSSQDIDKATSKGVRGGAPLAYELKSEDFNINRYYGVLSYGLTEDLEIIAKLGLADLKAEGKNISSPTPRWVGSNFDNDFAWGLAAKHTFLRQEKVEWGVSAQTNWLNTHWEHKGVDGDGPWKDESDLDAYDLIVAAGPTIDLDVWKLYGGLFYYYLDGEANTEGFEGDGETYKGRSDLEADGNLGAFIGAQFDLSSNIAWTSEFSVKENGWGLGTGITFKF